MQISNLLAQYEKALSNDTFFPDDIQRKAITYLDTIQKELTLRYYNNTKLTTKGILRHLFNFRNKKKHVKPIHGLYMWGSVGCGKTWLMDLFFQSIPSNRKLRLHFHRFMLRVHQELSQLQGQSNPLLRVADRFKTETDIICFDEFFVSDITDAMLLSILIEALFTRGITLVATSNISPDNLYHNGLQRTRFLSVIEQVKYHCTVINFNSGINYRMQRFRSSYLWHYPLNKLTYDEMRRMFFILSGKEYDTKEQILKINHRQIKTRGFINGVLAIDFLTICGDERSQYDYIEISSYFHSILLYDVPILLYKEDQARRFLTLIDELYDRNVKLIVAAETSLFEIYQGRNLTFEYQRCVSRLQEMQSEKYLCLPHLN
ncbi:cell division protein ZapE [Pantoea sp. Aalb]|uniref:cell division protein ZapE n=1 Tax=Pantoea sp. Aalb TaxID=2576762 RepID=UPI00132626EE|nr:cell division protein ZapE [Pantoea sp. Aalb]MXP67808.1 AFG1 family ATPase [Pantoea sp. Aalb]